MKKSILIFFTFFLTFLMQGWVLDKNNFFLFDDYSHFLNTQNCNLTIFPKQIYNDRPIGSCFINLLFKNFSWNNNLHHFVLLLIHIFNGFLLYFLIKYFLSDKKNNDFFIPTIIGTIFFLNYPISTMAFRWDSAIFDLLATTFLLLTILSAIHIKSKTISMFISLSFYIFSLRSKEFSVFIPLIFLIKESFSSLKNSVKTIFLPLSIIGIFYGFLLKYLGDVSNFSLKNNGGPYELGVSFSKIIENGFKYLVLFFDFKNSSFSFQEYRVHSILIILLFSIFLVKLLLKDWKKTTTIIIGLILSIIPVAILVNNQHRLYLYFPSVFISIFISYAVYKLFISYSLQIFSLIVFFLGYLNFINSSTLQQKTWWLEIGAQNKKQHEYMEKHPIDSNCVQVWTNDQTNIFVYGPGNYLKLKNKDIKVELMNFSEKNEKIIKENCSQIIINSNDILLSNPNF